MRYFHGAKPTTTGTTDIVTGTTLRTTGVGFTFGYQINGNLQIGASYFSSFADSNPKDLRADEFRLTINYGWHKIIEEMKRMSKH